MQKYASLIPELKATGLSDKAASLYAALLELGTAYPSKIAEVAKLNRTTTYHLLADLAIKGLVTEIQDGKKIRYQIEKPSRVLGFTQTQIRLAEERSEMAKKLLPKIEGLFSLTPHKPRVRFFEGLEGARALYQEHVNQAKGYEMVAFSNVEKLIQTPLKTIAKSYVAQKTRLGITTRAIFPDSAFSKKYNQRIYPDAPKKIQVNIRTIPAEIFPYQSEITAFGEKSISIINFEEETMIGVIIEDATIAGMFRMMFELSWAQAKRV